MAMSEEKRRLIDELENLATAVKRLWDLYEEFAPSSDNDFRDSELDSINLGDIYPMSLDEWWGQITHHVNELQEDAERSVPSIKGSFTQRQPDGSVRGLEFHGTVDVVYGDIEEAAKVVLEGEMHGNDGKTRVHIFLQ